MNPSIFGIIPARGGSKRLPGKNLRKLAGMSLVERAIRQAKQALPMLVVTTDDMKIIEEAMRCKAASLLRPDKLATDEATSESVIEHALTVFPVFQWFCLLQPTSPLRTVEDITRCIDLAMATGFPVVSTHHGKRNGAVYVARTVKQDGGYFEDAIHFEMPAERSVDIDTLHDFNEAERLLLELECKQSTDCLKK